MCLCSPFQDIGGGGAGGGGLSGREWGLAPTWALRWVIVRHRNATLRKCTQSLNAPSARGPGRPSPQLAIKEVHTNRPPPPPLLRLIAGAWGGSAPPPPRRAKNRAPQVIGARF